MMNLLNEYELAFGMLPSEPDSNQVLYVENHRNADLEQYITRNLKYIKRTFELYGLEFIYMPDMVDSMPNDVLRDAAGYYTPWLKHTDVDALRDACRIAIDELYSKVNLKDDAPAVVDCRGRAFKVDVRPMDYDALFYQIAQAYGHKNYASVSKHTLFREADWEACEAELKENDLPLPGVVIAEDEPTTYGNPYEYAQADQMYEELKRNHAGWWLEQLFAAQMRKDEVISRIVVDSPRRLLLPDYNNMEIRMNPATMAFYLLYLKHPEGIRFKELINYRQELYRIYSYTTKSDDKEAIERAVDAMVNQLDGNQNVHRSRIKTAIRNAFKDKFCERYARMYYLDGTKGEPMKVEIAREKDKIDWTKADL